VSAPVAPLPDHFKAKLVSSRAGESWELSCKRCKQRWSVPVEKASKPGVLLHLLDHAHGHAAKAVRR
jgi:hypothetical protein